MKKTMIIIKEDAKKRNIKNKAISGVIMVSEGMVTNYFKNKYMMPFHKYILLLKLIYEDVAKVDCYTDIYLNELIKNNKVENAKETIEWLFVNGKMEKARKIISKYKKVDMFFQVYDFLYKRNKKLIDTKEFMRNIERCKESGIVHDDTKSICRIAGIYAVLDLKGYSLINLLAEEALSATNKIKNDFLNKSFKTRIMEMKVISNLMNNNVNEAEQMCLDLISETNEIKYPLPVVTMLNVLSEIYAIRNFTKALEFNRKAIYILEDAKVTNLNVKSILEATHDFIKIFHRDFDNLYLTDEAEKAHYFASIGGVNNQQKALRILEKLEKENVGLTPHQTYYKGIALRSVELLEKAEYDFIKNGNIFYSFLPKIARKRMFLNTN